MKEYSVLVYIPASEVEVTVKADSLQEAALLVSLNVNDYWAKGVSWNCSSSKKVRITGVFDNETVA